MANYLKMTEASAILRLEEHGWSQRRIARELGIHPDTVGRYVHLSGRDSKPVKAPTGSGELNACNATSSRSQCDPFRKVIEDKLEEGLSRQRIYQDIRDEYGFEGSYYSVRRYVRRLGEDRPIPFRRMECMPGDESQIDFGIGAPVVRLCHQNIPEERSGHAGTAIWFGSSIAGWNRLSFMPRLSRGNFRRYSSIFIRKRYPRLKKARSGCFRKLL